MAGWHGGSINKMFDRDASKDGAYIARKDEKETNSNIG